MNEYEKKKRIGTNKRNRNKYLLLLLHVNFDKKIFCSIVP